LLAFPFRRGKSEALGERAGGEWETNPS